MGDSELLGLHGVVSRLGERASRCALAGDGGAEAACCWVRCVGWREAPQLGSSAGRLVNGRGCDQDRPNGFHSPFLVASSGWEWERQDRTTKKVARPPPSKKAAPPGQRRRDERRGMPPLVVAPRRRSPPNSCSGCPSAALRVNGGDAACATKTVAAPSQQESSPTGSAKTGREASVPHSTLAAASRRRARTSRPERRADQQSLSVRGARARRGRGLLAWRGRRASALRDRLSGRGR